MFGLFALAFKNAHQVAPFRTHHNKMPTTAPEAPLLQPHPRGGGAADRRFKCWSKQDKVRVLRSIMVELVDGKPPHGTLARIARNENVGHARVLRLWKLFRTDTPNVNNVLSNVSLIPKKKLARLGFSEYLEQPEQA
jgi:hypothetical protein